jgi:hypothetical protein
MSKKKKVSGRSTVGRDEQDRSRTRNERKDLKMKILCYEE